MDKSTVVIDVEDDEDEGRPAVKKPPPKASTSLPKKVQSSSSSMLKVKVPPTSLEGTSGCDDMYKNVIIIKGLPQPLTCDLRDVIRRIGAFYHVRITRGDISCAYLLMQKNFNEGSIVVAKFSNDLIHCHLLKRHLKSKRELPVYLLGLCGASVVRITNQLTPSNRDLIKMANQIFHSKGIIDKKNVSASQQKSISSLNTVKKPIAGSNTNIVPAPSEVSTTSATEATDVQVQIKSTYSLLNGEKYFPSVPSGSEGASNKDFIIEELYSSSAESSLSEDEESNEIFYNNLTGKVWTYNELLKTVHTRELRVIVERLDYKSLPLAIAKMRRDNFANTKSPLLLKSQKVLVDPKLYYRKEEEAPEPDPNLLSSQKEGIIKEIRIRKRKKRSSAGEGRSDIDSDGSDSEGSVSPPLAVESLTTAVSKRGGRVTTPPRKLENFICLIKSSGLEHESESEYAPSNGKRRKIDDNLLLKDIELPLTQEETVRLIEKHLCYPRGRGRPTKEWKQKVNKLGAELFEHFQKESTTTSNLTEILRSFQKEDGARYLKLKKRQGDKSLSNDDEALPAPTPPPPPSTQTQNSTENQISTESTIGTDNHVRTESQIGTDKDVRTESQIGTDKAVRTESQTGMEIEAEAVVQTKTEIQDKTESIVETNSQISKPKSLVSKLQTNNMLFISTSNQLIEHLRVRNLFDSNIESQLLRNFGGLPWKVIVKPKRVESAPQCDFSTFQNHFAISLFLFAPKAFRFLSETFCLPQPEALSKMLDSRRGEAGFLTEVLDHIKVNLTDRGRVDFCLLVDRLPLKKGVFWDPIVDKFYGYVESCPTVRCDNTLATEALVVFANSLQTHFKMPIGYFLLENVCPGVLTKIIDCSISKLSERGARVWSVTLEASDVSLNSIRQLGCPFNVELCEMSHFRHATSDTDVFIVFDTHHLLKTARNVLAEKEVIVSPKGSIDWHYIKIIKHLFSKKEETLKYCNYYDLLTLSESVAHTLDSLRNQKVPEFLGSEPTSEFIKTLNRVHSLANCLNPFGKGCLKPFSSNTLDRYLWMLYQCRSYLADVIIEGVPIARHNRKLFILGFLMTIKSIGEIANHLIRKSKAIDYLCTGLLSLDHIDSFYSNLIEEQELKGPPTTLDFKNGIKECMRRNLHAYSVYNNYYLSIIDFRSEKRSCHTEQADDRPLKLDFYFSCLTKQDLKIYSDEILNILSNKIVDLLVKKVSCSLCAVMLQKDLDRMTVDQHDYIASTCVKDLKLLFKRRGPSNSSLNVYRVLQCCEKSFKYCKNTESLADFNFFQYKIIYLTKKRLVKSSVYPFLEYRHPLSEAICQPIHEYQLVDLICKEYARFRTSTLKFLF